QVLGVDPIKNLVVPRFLALMVVTGLFNIYALIFGIVGGVLATLTFDAPLGPFFSTLLSNASTTDLWGSVVKTTLFGAIIAIVSCYKGMTASGGAAGVGRASWLVASSDERNKARRARAPRRLIDLAMTISAVTALVLMLVWFFFFAHMFLVSWQ